LKHEDTGLPCVVPRRNPCDPAHMGANKGRPIDGRKKGGGDTSCPLLNEPDTLSRKFRHNGSGQ